MTTAWDTTPEWAGGAKLLVPITENKFEWSACRLDKASIPTRIRMFVVWHTRRCPRLGLDEKPVWHE